MKRLSERYDRGILKKLSFTPLLILAFILLVTIAISLPFLPGVSADPQTPENDASGQKGTPHQVIPVSVDASRVLHYGGAPIPPTEFGAALEAIRRDAPEGTTLGVLIEAHHDLEKGDLRHVLEPIRKAGIPQVAISLPSETSTSIASYP